MRFKFGSAAALCWAWVLGCGGDTADQVVRNAHIVAMDGRGTTAQAMAVKDGRVLALGKEQEILNAHRGARVVDVKGHGVPRAHRRPQPPARVRPGFGSVECGGHHLLQGSGGAVSKASPAASGWIRGRGWDQNDWADRTSLTGALDSLHPDTPWSCNGSTATLCWPTVRH